MTKAYCYLLVPGVPEAESDADAADALGRFIALIESRVPADEVPA